MSSQGPLSNAIAKDKNLEAEADKERQTIQEIESAVKRTTNSGSTEETMWPVGGWGGVRSHWLACMCVQPFPTHFTIP